MIGILVTALSLHFLPGFSWSSPDESAFGLAYNGGKIMTEPVTVSLIWFGTGWRESSRGAVRNVITSLSPSRYNGKDSEVPTLGDWWNVVIQYRDSSNSPVTDKVDVGDECFYKGPELNMTLDQVVEISQTVFNNSAIEKYGGNLNCTRVFEVKENWIYHILFSHTVMFVDEQKQRDLMNLCSDKFQIEIVAGMTVNMTWTREPQHEDDHCSISFHRSYYVGPPNGGDEKVDSLVRNMLARIAEEVTNSDGRGWSSNDGNGLTVSSSCSPPFLNAKIGPPLYVDEEMKMSFNAVGLNGYKYILPYIWNQKIKNCALKLSETCSRNAVRLERPRGILKGGIAVNHTDGLQPYPPNQKCRWEINFPDVKFISFTINYFAVAEDSDDHLLICQSHISIVQCSSIQANHEDFDKKFRVLGSKATVEFTSGDQVSFESRGWELSYSAGLCNGKKDIYDHDGVIGYGSSAGFSYVEDLTCQWILHGKPRTLVSLNFSLINISKNLDFLAIYDDRKQQIANFSGLYYGSDLPHLNLTGEVMLVFATQTDKGEGWEAEFYISSPVDQEKKVLIVIAIVVLAVVAASVSLALVTLAIVKRRRMHKCSMVSVEKQMQLRVDVCREENRIGEGPSAIVYRAVSTNGIVVAVKARRDMASQTGLEEEILLKSSSHPNIVSLLGHAQDGLQRQYLVFEFMQMGSLSSNLRERGGTLDWEKRLAIALQICSAIQMLHMYSKPPIYHGNITSENILLDEFCNAKLGGFASANYCSSNNRPNPEQTSEMAEDIWSFGILLVELLRGESLENRHTYKKFSSLDQINDFVGGPECLDQRLNIPIEKCKIMGLTKLSEIAKWCIGCCCRVKGNENDPKIGDVLSGLRQVKQLFCSVLF